jgi:hypothetical protein
MSQRDCELDIKRTSTFIAEIQKANGEIPWSAGGKTDVWDHIESAMGLSTGGFWREARRAYEWAASTQLADGSWWSATKDGAVLDSTKDSNFSSYIAVGVYHHYLVTGDQDFVEMMWETVAKGINFALSLQAPSGKIYWACDERGVVDKMALLTGSSSVLMSIKCALALARLLDKDVGDWAAAAGKLRQAIRYKQHLFNKKKSRFSMDWYYPILCGAFNSQAALKRLAKGWDKFFQPEMGVRCVCDRPWATMAETAELAISLAAIGDYSRAHQVFGCLLNKRYPDGSFWMGVTFPDGVIWPEEKTSWTAGAVLIAADAIYGLTGAHCLFYHRFWEAAANTAAPEAMKTEYHSGRVTQA